MDKYDKEDDIRAVNDQIKRIITENDASDWELSKPMMRALEVSHLRT